MRYTYAMTIQDMLAWDEQLAHNPDGSNVFQSAELAETKRLNHWTPLYRTFSGVAVTILQKSVKHLGTYWYIPKGPGISTASQLQNVLPELQAEAKKNNVFAVKIEPELVLSVDTYRQITALGLVPSRSVQPNSSTVLIDISPPLDTVIANFTQKARHAIRRAERDGVVAKPVLFTANNAKLMYDLLTQTAVGRFEGSLRPYDYYYRFWETFYDTGQGSFFFAYVDDQVVAAAFAMHIGHKSTYKDGASVRDKQTYGASHLLQWEIIKWMKQRGCRQHDLCGAPPSQSVNDSSHPLYGVGLFKTSFNKQVTDYVGGFDLPIKPFTYKIWIKIGERLTLRRYYKRHRQVWY